MGRQDMAKWMLCTIAQDFGFIGSRCEDYDEMMRHDHGGGRGKPVWAERIGKKYMWTAMQQLASRLHDNVVRKRDEWEPEPIRTPLILPESRQLDPSLLQRCDQSKTHPFFTAVRLDTESTSDDRTWVALEHDVPNICELVKVQSVDGQDWRSLVANLHSGSPGYPRDEAGYRHIWLSLAGYLVRPIDASAALEKLGGRNFLGDWMPQGLGLGVGVGFAAEYPWATSFNTMPEEGHSHVKDSLAKCLAPAWNQLTCEWEYDESREKMHVYVPARLFFDGDELWWDGQGGYRRGDGRAAFVDPSFRRAGPWTLLADEEHLRARLRELDRCLIWTLVGQKWILGGFPGKGERTPIRTFSQVAYMDSAGTFKKSDMAFFDDPSQRTGLAE